MNHLLVARHDGVDRRILPCPQTFEAKLACVIGERCENVDSRAPVSTGDGEEHRRNLTDHAAKSTPDVKSGGEREVVGTFAGLNVGREAGGYATHLMVSFLRFLAQSRR